MDQLTLFKIIVGAFWLWTLWGAFRTGQEHPDLWRDD